MIVIWRRRQTNQILSYDHFAFIRTFDISVAMNSRVLSKFDITFFCCFHSRCICTSYSVLSCILFIYPFIIVFVLDARVQRLHFQRNKHRKNVDRIKLFLFRTFAVYSIILTPQFLIKHQLFFVPSIFELDENACWCVFFFLILHCLHYMFIFHLCANIGVVDWSFAVFHSTVHLLLTNIRI